MAKQPPPYSIRLSLADRKNLEEVAKIIGATPSGFAALTIGAIVSRDQQRIEDFMSKLLMAYAGQYSLKLTQAHVWEPRQTPQTVKRRRKGAKPR